MDDCIEEESDSMLIIFDDDMNFTGDLKDLDHYERLTCGFYHFPDNRQQMVYISGEDAEDFSLAFVYSYAGVCLFNHVAQHSVLYS